MTLPLFYRWPHSIWWLFRILPIRAWPSSVFDASDLSWYRPTCWKRCIDSTALVIYGNYLRYNAVMFGIVSTTLNTWHLLFDIPDIVVLYWWFVHSDNTVYADMTIPSIVYSFADVMTTSTCQSLLHNNGRVWYAVAIQWPTGDCY